MTLKRKFITGQTLTAFKDVNDQILRFEKVILTNIHDDSFEIQKVSDYRDYVIDGYPEDYFDLHINISDYINNIESPLDLAEFISNARKDRKITQAELAHRIDISQPMMQGIESGKKKINLILLFKILDALGIDFMFLNKKK